MIKNYSVLAIFLIGLVFLSGCVTYQPYFPQDGGQGPPPPTCSKHAEVRCQGDCVFWYDSCGNQEEMKECCPHGCMNGECTDTNPCEQAEGYCQSSIAEALCREGFEESNISCYSDTKICCAPVGCPEGGCIVGGTPELLVSTDSRQTEPSIYGNVIAYVDDWNDPDGDIFIYYISKETQTPAAEGGGYQYDPVVCSDKYMVYGEKNGNGLYLYDMGTKETETIFMQDQEDQDCSNTYVVWRERKTDKFLYLYEISDKTTEKIRDTIKLDTNNEIVSPSTDGNYVVWGEENFNEKDIYLYEISTNTTTMISDNETFDSWPDISGNKVIWIQGEPGSMDIIVYDTVSKTRKALGLADFGLISQPRINGNMIAWTGCRSDKYRVHYSESGFTITMSCIDFDVYAYNLNREELHVVETSTDEQRHAEVYGKNIVWHGWDRRKNNKPKIYMKTIQTTATPIIPQEMVLSSLVKGCAETEEGMATKFGEGTEQEPKIEVIGNDIVYSRALKHLCCRKAVTGRDASGSVINIYEVWSGIGCKCICFSEIEAKLENVPSGSYTVNVYEKGTQPGSEEPMEQTLIISQDVSV